MLKIKDNVDLKELEKYGFKSGEDLAKEDLYKDIICDPGTKYMFNWLHKIEFDEDYDYDDEEWIRNGSIGHPPIKPIINRYGEYQYRIHIWIRDDSREILIDVMNNDYSYHTDELTFIENTLYDLIKDGLVEKVGE